MRIFGFAVSLALAITSAASAHPRLSTLADSGSAHGRVRNRAVHIVDEPRVRIRNDETGEGLTPLAFAKWVAAHPRLINFDVATFKRTSSGTSLLNRTAPMFASADQDGNKRVSGAELADFVGSWPRVASIARTA